MTFTTSPKWYGPVYSVGLVVLKGKDTMGKRWLKVRVGDKIFVYQSGYAFMGMDEYEDYSDTLEIVSNG